MKKKITVGNKVLFIICLMYFIVYIDRVNIATAAPFIEKDLHLSTTEMGLILSAFAYPYAFFQIFGGWIGDKFGPRKTLTVVGAVWSAATALTGAVTGLVSAFIARFALGFGEGASFPTATKAMSNWLPVEKHGTAQGIVHSSSRLGNAITPPLIAFLIVSLGWRESFWILGGISFIWMFIWVWYFRDNPAHHPEMTKEELETIPLYKMREDRGTGSVPWKKLFKRILPVTLIDFCYGWSLWVYLTWLPSLMYDGYGMDIKKSALFSAGILMAGVIGDSVGGIFSDGIFKRTKNLRRARRTNLVIGLSGSFLFLLPTLFVHNLVIIAISLSIAFFFLELNNSVLWAIPMDIAPDDAGKASGLMNTGFGLAGVLSPLVFGFLIDLTGSWQVPFIMSVVLLIIGIIVSLRIDPSKRVTAEPKLQINTDKNPEIFPGSER